MAASTRPSSIPQALLKGHELTGEKCPENGCVTPMLRSRSHGLYCPVHGTTPDSRATRNENQKIEQTAADGNNKSTARRKSRDEATESISHKLLEGWKLLGQHCPMDNCGTPLLADRDGHMWCTAHELWVVPEGSTDTGNANSTTEMHAASTDQMQKTRHKQSHSSARTLPWLSEEITQESKDAAHGKEQADVTTATVQHSDRSGTRLPKALNDASAFSTPSASSPACLQHASSTVAEKIEWAQAQLSNESDLARCRSLAQLISDLAQAMSHLNYLS